MWKILNWCKNTWILLVKIVRRSHLSRAHSHRRMFYRRCGILCERTMASWCLWNISQSESRSLMPTAFALSPAKCVLYCIILGRFLSTSIDFWVSSREVHAYELVDICLASIEYNWKHFELFLTQKNKRFLQNLIHLKRITIGYVSVTKWWFKIFVREKKIL